MHPYPFEELNEILKYRVLGWEFTPSGKIYGVTINEDGEEIVRGWDGYRHLIKNNTIGAGLFLALKEKMESEANVQFKVEDQRQPPKFKKVAIEKDSKIRAYQIECLEKMIEASGTGGLILQATGSGKTWLSAEYFRRLVGSAVFLVDELQLLDQARKELESVLGESVGEIGNSIFAPKRITVATVQTVHRHRFDPPFFPWIKSLQAIIIDEVHISLNRRNFQTVATINPPVVFGLTATLQLRKKHISMPAYGLAGPVIFEYPLEQGEREGYLSKGIAVLVQIQNEVEAEKYTGKGGWWKRRQFYRDRYPEAYRQIVVEGRERNRLVQQLASEAHRKGKYTIVLVERIQHLYNLSDSLTNVPHDLVFGGRKVARRLEATAAFEKGEVRLLLANKVFAKGINIKRVDVIIDAAGMKSENTAQQKYGRGVRLCDQKSGLIYFDISDKGNSFEKAARSRQRALKKLGIPIYKADSKLGAKKILELAEGKLAQRAGEHEKGF